MRLLLALALIITGILGVVFITDGTFAANWPIALIPIGAWIALYVLLRLLILVIGFFIVVTAISKARREQNTTLPEAAEIVRARSRKATKPSDLFHD